MGYQTDPMEPPIPAPTPQPTPAPQNNKPLYRAQMLRQFLAANPGRQAPPMGRNPDGSIAYDPSVYGSQGPQPQPFGGTAGPPSPSVPPSGGYAPKSANPLNLSGDRMGMLMNAIKPRRGGF